MYGLETGKAFPREIEKNATTAKAVLVLWSTRSVESEWVREEAGIGKENGVLVPALLEPCKPPLGFTLRQAQELFDTDVRNDDPAWRREDCQHRLLRGDDETSSYVGVSGSRRGFRVVRDDPLR